MACGNLETIPNQQQDYTWLQSGHSTMCRYRNVYSESGQCWQVTGKTMVNSLLKLLLSFWWNCSHDFQCQNGVLMGDWKWVSGHLPDTFDLLDSRGHRFGCHFQSSVGKNCIAYCNWYTLLLRVTVCLWWREFIFCAVHVVPIKRAILSLIVIAS